MEPTLFRILLVEDDPIQAEIVSKILLQFNFAVTVASDAHQARRKLEASQFDIMLLDIMLPIHDGFHLLASGLPRQLPVIMLTAHGTRDYVVQAAKYPIIQGFLVKPVQENQLIDKLIAALKLPPNALIRRADMPLDVNADSATPARLLIRISGIATDAKELIKVSGQIGNDFKDLSDIRISVESMFSLSPDPLEFLATFVTHLVAAARVAPQRMTLQGPFFTDAIRAQVDEHKLLSSCKLDRS